MSLPQVAKDAAEVGSLFIGEVGVKDYAEKDNQELADRFSITKDDFPTAVLFRPGPARELEQFRFPGKLKADELKSFVKEKVSDRSPGCSIIQLDANISMHVVAHNLFNGKFIVHCPGGDPPPNARLPGGV